MKTKTSDNEPNIKLPLFTISQLKSINSRLVKQGFDNVKVLISVITDEFERTSKNMSSQELFAFVVSKTYDLQKKGVVKDNARSIGKKHSDKK